MGFTANPTENVSRPATAFVLLPLVGYHYPTMFALTLIPGLIAVALIAFVSAVDGGAVPQRLADRGLRLNHP